MLFPRVEALGHDNRRGVGGQIPENPVTRLRLGSMAP